jgi:hypothetical protein
MRAFFLLLTALAVVISAGLVHGFWIDRWQISTDLDDAAALLDRVGMDLDPWHAEAVELDPRAVRVSGASRYVMRRYTHRTARTSASVLLMCGRSGPMSVHTPDICYQGSGFEVLGAPARYTVPAGPSSAAAAFWTAKFRKRDAAVPMYLRIYWSWKVPGGTWVAPDSARVTFGRPPALYKLYVIREMPAPDERPENDPSVGLVQRYLAELESEPKTGVYHHRDTENTEKKERQTSRNTLLPSCGRSGCCMEPICLVSSLCSLCLCGE